MVFSAPLFLLSMVLMYIPGPKEGLDTHVLGFPLLEILTFCLATPVQVGGWVGGWVGRLLSDVQRVSGQPSLLGTPLGVPALIG